MDTSKASASPGRGPARLFCEECQIGFVVESLFRDHWDLHRETDS